MAPSAPSSLGSYPYVSAACLASGKIRALQPGSVPVGMIKLGVVCQRGGNKAIIVSLDFAACEDEVYYLSSFCTQS